MVNDGNLDGSWETIVELTKKDNRVKGLNLSRNFGQHNAITAGLAHCTGEWVIVIDCDLQDQPEEIRRLLEKAEEGFDIVLAQRINRRDSLLKKILSKIFYKILSYLTESKQDYRVANYGIYSKKVIKAILDMKDYIRYFPTMVRWVGFRQVTIEVEHSDRVSGKTSYSVKMLFKLALDIILSFSDKPLRLTIKLGLWISFLAILYALYNELIENYGFDVLYKTYFFSFLVIPIFLFRTIPSIFGVYKISSQQFKNQHLSNSNANKLLDLLMKIELQKVKINKSIIFGSSILLVARKR